MFSMNVDTVFFITTKYDNDVFQHKQFNITYKLIFDDYAKIIIKIRSLILISILYFYGTCT